MKKIVAIILAMIMVVVAFSACSKKSEPTKATKDEEAVTALDKTMEAKALPVAESYKGGSGTAKDPYQIENKEQLALMANQINDGSAAEACFVLVDDIAVNDTESFSKWGQQAPEYKWTGANEFSGVFDGDGHTISGLYMCEVGTYSGLENSSIDTYKTENEYNMGLFRTLNGATVKDLTISESYFKCLNQAETGAFAGRVTAGSIENCKLEKSNLDSRLGDVGGLAGSIAATGLGMKNCSTDDVVSVNLSGSGNAGGCVGYVNGTDISDCVSRGSVYANDTLGGFAGSVSAGDGKATITNVKSYANVVGDESDSTSRAGGCFGSLSGGLKSESALEIKDCENYSTKISGSYIGGLVGYCAADSGSKLIIEDCANNADLKTNSDSAGIAGYALALNKGTVSFEDCENSGNISNSEDSAGIVATLALNCGTATLTGCENKGAVNSTGNCGGIISAVFLSESEKEKPNNLNVKSCVNSGKVGGTDTGLAVGGIAANIGSLLGTAANSDGDNSGVLFTNEWDSFVIEDCTNNGTVEIKANKGSTTFGGGIVGVWCDDKSYCAIKNCVNKGTVQAVEAGEKEDLNGKKLESGVAGIIGLADKNIGVSNCKNSGKLKAPDYMLSNDLVASDRGLFNSVEDK